MTILSGFSDLFLGYDSEEEEPDEVPLETESEMFECLKKLEFEQLEKREFGPLRKLKFPRFTTLELERLRKLVEEWAIEELERLEKLELEWSRREEKEWLKKEIDRFEKLELERLEKLELERLEKLELEWSRREEKEWLKKELKRSRKVKKERFRKELEWSRREEEERLKKELKKKIRLLALLAKPVELMRYSFIRHLSANLDIATSPKRKRRLTDTSDNDHDDNSPRHKATRMDDENNMFCKDSFDDYCQETDKQTSGPIIHDVTDADIIYAPFSSKTSTATTSSSKPAEKFDIAHLSLPSDLLNAPSLSVEELKTEEMKLSKEIIFPEATVDLPGSVSNDISLSDLSIIPSSTDTQSLPQPRSEMSDHVDTVQSELDGLQDPLPGSNNLDTSILLGILSELDGVKTDDAPNTGQVVQYKSSDDDIPDISDLAAMSKDDAEEDPLSESDVNQY